MLSDYNIQTCNSNDIWYPRGMKNLPGMPPQLYYKGNIEIVNSYKNVAVIGSRKSSQNGMRLSYEAGRTSAELGITVINGLALGCDAEAMRGALSVGGKCIAVMPYGLEQIVPKSNCGLAEEILEKGGCLISQYPVGTAAREYQYVERDKLQSAISQGVLIVEAQEKSGTMHTADFAIRQYKRLACYYSMMVNEASGNKVLENKGKANVLRTEQDLRTYLVSIAEEGEYEQLTLNIGV